LILETKRVKNLLAKATTSLAHQIATKLKQLNNKNEQTNCGANKFLIYDLENLNAVHCGLGCQLHGFSSGILCASESKRHFSIINYSKDQYQKYFDFFNHSCSHESSSSAEISKAGKLGLQAFLH
jgi:hypothetical protein